MKRQTGNLVTTSTVDEKVRSFVPFDLPPDPAIDLNGQILQKLGAADRALGRLDGMARLLPEPFLFIYFYVRKEALLSSQIEGTQSSLNDLLLYEVEEAPGVPLDDVKEVSNYVAAINHGLSRIKEDFPLSLRLIREIHEVLLSSGRGEHQTPGEFRRSQNWIGGTRPGNAAYVPPPPDKVVELMSSLEKFLHDDPSNLPVLVRIGLIHVQFESIHPFLDGNGRLGRLLITLWLCSNGILHEPLLYLSLYFKNNRSKYYELLQQVREDGDWETWLEFFLDGVAETADQAADTAKSLLELFEADRRKVEALGGIANSALRVHHFLQTKPLTSVTMIAKEVGITYPTVKNAIDKMQKLEIVREITGRRRNRIYAYWKYIDILNAGTKP